MHDDGGSGGTTPSPSRGLRPAVLYTNIFLVMFGFGALAPALPDLRSTYAISSGAVTLAITAFATARLLTSIPASRIVLAFGERHALLAGTAAVVAGNGLSAIAPTYWSFIGGRVIAGVGSGLAIIVGLAVLVGGANDEARGRASARYHAALAGGILFGPGIGGLLAHLGSWRLICAVSAFAAAVSLAVIAVGSRPHGQRIAIAATPTATLRRPPAAPRIARSDLLVLGTVATVCIFFVRGASQLTLLPLMGADELGLSTASIGLVLMVPSIVEIVLGPVVGSLGDRVGRARVVVPALALLGTGVIVLGNASTTAWFVAGATIAAGASAANGLAPALLIDGSPPSRQGRAIAAYRFAADSSFAIGPLATGWLVTHHGFAATGTTIGVATLASLTVASIVAARGRTAGRSRPLPPTNRRSTGGRPTLSPTNGSGHSARLDPQVSRQVSQQGGAMPATRIWDQYLTERDRAHLATVGHRGRVGWGQRPAVLLIDNYWGVLGDGPEPLLDQVRHLPMGTGEEGWAAIEQIASVVAAAREVSVPVVHIKGLATDGLAGFVDAFRAGRHRDLEAARRGFEIVPALAPSPGEVVLEKASASAFFGTPLVGHLQHLGVDTLVICGETTSGCVRASVVDACSHRFRVIVPEECSYDRHQACHAINLFDMDQKYADVVPVAEVFDHFASTDTSLVDAGSMVTA